MTIPYSAVTFEKKVDNTVHVTALKIIGNDNIAIDHGQQHVQFGVRVEPKNATNQEIKWSSSDESKATIDSKGIMTMKSDGDLVITATSVDNPDAKATCHVRIRPWPQTITLDKKTISIIKGSDENLTATVKPDGANQGTEWISDNEAVAIGYPSGFVRAVSAGKANIKVESWLDDSIFATCEVTVTDPTASITLNKTGTVNVNTGDTLQLTATVKPDIDVYKNIQWSTNNPTIADVSSSGLVSFKKAGTAIISAVSAFDPSIVAKVTFNVTDAQVMS